MFLIAVFVTASTLAVVGNRVLRPLGRITGAIRAARRTGQRDYIDPDQPGEFGELVADYNATIAEQRAAEERGELLHHQAMHDPLTGLPNRSLFADRLDQALTRSRRYGERAAVLLLDVDRFKLFNDTYGHVAGDALLGAVGERLSGALRTSDTVARIGGDEFALIQPRVGSDAECLALADRVRRAMAAPFEPQQRRVTLGASVGVTVLPDDGDDRDTLLVNADLAMYRAKHDGGDRVRRFDPSMRADVVRQVELEGALHQALDTDQFELHYQPIVDLHDGRVCAFEALLRWQHPEWGLIPPAHFLPLVEQTAMIGPLGDWVLWRAAQDVGALQALAPACERVAVNVSAEQLALADADVLVARATRAAGVPAQALTLEITETAVLRSSPATIAGLERAAASGALIAIDDFGTGYSSLAQVQDLPGHVLKIDRRFVAALSESARSRDLFHAIVAMGHSLGMKVIAEGIETVAQLETVRACGCDAAQGFLFARPQALGALEAESAWLPPALAGAGH
ncbi:MAG: EAL domain-containing protein [Halofilum sp. (in: g-proteobacteria)]|nr:EAL domain-containing protein [Halofilum sp. (in: g-proteobacteria)]